MKLSQLLRAALAALLLLCVAGCGPWAGSPPQNPASQQVTSPTQELPAPLPPSAGPEDTETADGSAQPSRSQPQDGWKLDESILTDDYLISLVIRFEVSLEHEGRERFIFDERQPLTASQLYRAFLLLSDYDELEAKYWNEADGKFYFTSDVIVDKLSRYFKNVSFDITQYPEYDAGANAIVTPLASGFGGDRYMKLTEKSVNGNIVTFTADFYEDYGLTGNVYQAKTYGIEFYEGGFYYLYAVEA